MARRCWAAVIGECAGPITAEHLVSAAQLSDTIHVRGFPWCKTEFKEIGKAAFVAKVLCRRHNNQLSDTDQEATRFRSFLPKFFFVKKDQKIPVGERFFTLDGILFSRWLCKTYCDRIAGADQTPNIDFVRYAFGIQTYRPLFFYVSAVEGMSIQAEDRSFHFHEYHNPEDDILACFNFWGFRWLAANVSIDTSITPLLRNDGIPVHAGPLWDRPRSFVYQSNHRITPRTLGELKIDWHDDHKKNAK